MRRRALMALLATAPLRGALAQPAFGGPFSLTGGGGQITDASFPGKFLLLFFGYTNCPDICPTTLYNIAQALQRLGPRARHVQALFVTVDPARDSPARVARYAALFSPAIIGLSGTPAEIARVEIEYHVFVKPAGPEGIIAHSALLYVIAPDGKFLAALPDGMSSAAMAQSLIQWMDADR